MFYLYIYMSIHLFATPRFSVVAFSPISISTEPTTVLVQVY